MEKAHLSQWHLSNYSEIFSACHDSAESLRESLKVEARHSALVSA